MVADNVQYVLHRIAAACDSVGRKPEEVTLVSVAKTFGSDHIRAALGAGALDIGENYVQELLAKHKDIDDPRIRWHFIGHLQTNKVRRIAGLVHMIHSVDSVHLGKEISKEGERIGKRISVLLEVNTSGEATKYGVEPTRAHSLAYELSELSYLDVAGLMTIGPFLPDPEASRPAFRMLRRLRDTIEESGISMRHLSMGMTNDFEVAIQEGATIVRIGTAVFGKRSGKKNALDVSRTTSA